MSCCEHHCVNCDFATFNNQSVPRVCPRCGGRLAHYYDEPDESYKYNYNSRNKADYEQQEQESRLWPSLDTEE